MAMTIELDGNEIGVKSLTVNQSLNGHDVIRCVVPSDDATLDPDIDVDLEISLDSTPWLAGSVKKVEIEDYEDSDATLVTIEAQGRSEKAVRQTIVLATVAAGSTLKQAAEIVLGYVDGTTLETGHPDGPIIEEELRFENITPYEALDLLSQRTGWLRRVGPDDKLKFFAIGSISAPFSVTDDTGHFGKTKVIKTRVGYLNKLIVKFLAAAQKAYARLNGTGNFADGDTTTIGGKIYTWQTTLTDEDGHVKLGADLSESLDILIDAIVNGGPAGNPATVAASTVVHPSVSAFRDSSGGLTAVAKTAGASGNSIGVETTALDVSWTTEGGATTVTLAFGLDESLSNSVTVDDLVGQGLYGIYSGIIEAASTYTSEAATALGQAVLDSVSTTPKTIVYENDDESAIFYPGMSQSIALTGKISATCFIVDVAGRRDVDRGLVRTVTVVEGSAYNRRQRWQQKWSDWIGGKSGSASSVIGTGAGTVTVTGSAVWPLQTSPEIWIERGAAETWVPVHGEELLVSGARQGGLRLVIDSAERGTRNGIAVLRARTRGGSVTFRLRDVLAGSTVGTSDAVSSTEFVLLTFPVVLTEGIGHYELQGYPSDAGVGFNVVGYFR